ncbi:MAG: SDR family NAD(P)-dependent oxidoreductase, partial [Clostridium sp.]|nr:SDR family NAD(P)-dependent oxidoreductase [Clostridium sp.]
GTAAFAKSMLYENPNIICKTLGLEKVDSMNKADQIWTELTEEEFTCSNIQITSDGRKEKKNREIIEQSPDSVSIKEGGVYLITGGTGGLGKIFSKYLATRTAVTLILTGRKALDARIEEQMKQLKEFGARAVYVPCDASSMEDVRKLYRFCKEKFGQVNGIIHAAGVLKDSYIIKKTREEVEQVLAPKILGIRNLDIAFQKEELDFFLSFSSLAAVDGCAGQCDYAYANYYMEGYTCYRKELCKQGKRFGCSKVINWPVWKHGGMGVDKEQEETMKRRIGLLLLDTQEGMKAFEKAMSSTCSQFGVVRANRSKLARLMEILPYQNCEESKLEIDIPDEILNKDMSEVIGELELLLEELE